MSAAVQTTIDLLETELAKVRTALQEVPSDPLQFVVLGEDVTTGALATRKKNLIGYDHDFFSGNQRLTAKELGLVTVQEIEIVPTPVEEKTIELPKPPTNLVDILSNNVILHHLAPLLPMSSLLSLASTCNTARFIIHNTPYVFRHLDLTTCRGAKLPKAAAIDVVEDSWRREPTEDEFYAAPLRGIFDRLEKQLILPSVRTLVLDGLPVTADLVADIILTDRFNVNILSIRDCLHLNEQKLMQTLTYAVRPSRPAGTPKVKGIYHFTSKASGSDSHWGQRLSSRREWWKTRTGVSPCSSGSTTPVPSDSKEDYLNEWYRPSGQLLRGSTEHGWAQVIKKCEGIIAFDAVLCRGPRHNVDLYSLSNTSKPRPEEGLLAPAIATVSLGPRGCDGCRTSPEGPAIWGESPDYYFPLLNPLPLYTSNVLEAKRPVPKNETAIMIASCMECLKNRWCHRCNKWFCFSCLPSPDEAGTRLSPHQTVVRRRHGSQETGPSTPKLGPGVSKDCWECGPTCASCKVDRQLSCSSCFGEYCFEHNDGCSTTKCDWCNISSRRLGRNIL